MDAAKEIGVKVAEISLPAALAAAIAITLGFIALAYKVWHDAEKGALRTFALCCAVGFGIFVPIGLVSSYNAAVKECRTLGESGEYGTQVVDFNSDHCSSVVECTRDFPIRGNPPRQHCS